MSIAGNLIVVREQLCRADTVDWPSPLGFYSVSVFAESEHGFELAQPPPAGLPITDFGRLFEANDLAGARAWSAELQKKLDAMNTGPLWAIVCEGWPDTDIITFGNQH